MRTQESCWVGARLDRAEQRGTGPQRSRARWVLRGWELQLRQETSARSAFPCAACIAASISACAPATSAPFTSLARRRMPQSHFAVIRRLGKQFGNGLLEHGMLHVRPRSRRTARAQISAPPSADEESAARARSQRLEPNSSTSISIVRDSFGPSEFARRLRPSDCSMISSVCINCLGCMFVSASITPFKNHPPPRTSTGSVS